MKPFSFLNVANCKSSCNICEKQYCVCLMVFNTTFSYIVAVFFFWCRKPEYPTKTTDLPQITEKLYHIMLYWVNFAWARFNLTTLVVIGTIFQTFLSQYFKLYRVGRCNQSTRRKQHTCVVISDTYIIDWCKSDYHKIAITVHAPLVAPVMSLLKVALNTHSPNSSMERCTRYNLTWKKNTCYVSLILLYEFCLIYGCHSFVFIWIWIMNN
jgi:hypothetical protein